MRFLAEIVIWNCFLPCTRTAVLFTNKSFKMTIVHEQPVIKMQLYEISYLAAGVIKSVTKAVVTKNPLVIQIQVYINLSCTQLMHALRTTHFM